MDGQSPPNPQPPRADSLFHVVLRRLAQLLNEALMGFLALVAMGLGLAPMLFQVSRPADTIMNSVQSAIVVLFAAEYLTHLFLAERKAAYALNPWRLLDLAIIATASLALVLDSSDLLQSSPMLRLLRLPIVLYFGARAGGAIIREEDRKSVV